MKMKLWTENFIKMFAANFINANSFYILLAVIPMFITHELNLGKSKVGIIMGSFSITAVLVRPFIGVLLDSIGRKPVYRISMVFFTICCGMHMLVGSFASILALRLLYGMAWGMTSTSGATLATDIITPERRAEGLGYYVLAMNIGMALGPGVGVFLLGMLTFKEIFFVCIIICSIATFISFSVKYTDKPSKKPVLTRNSFIEKKVAGLALIYLLYGFSYAGMVNYVIIFSHDNKIGGGSLFFAVYAIVMAAIRPFSGKYLDKNGPGNLMGIGFFTLIAGFIALSFTSNILIFIAASILLGIGGGIVSPLLSAMAMNIVDFNRRGIANATVFSAFDLGIGGGSVVMGYIADMFSTTGMFLFAGIFLMLPLMYYYLSVKQNYEKIMHTT